MTTASHLAIQHHLWRFTERPASGTDCYGSMVSEAGLQVLHAMLHEAEGDGDHPFVYDHEYEYAV